MTFGKKYLTEKILYKSNITTSKTPSTLNVAEKLNILFAKVRNVFYSGGALFCQKSVYFPSDLVEKSNSFARQGFTLQRFKGLGEMFKR